MALKNLFFYGTLRHAPLLECVLGKPVSALRILPAVLHDHAIHGVENEDFPLIIAKPGAQASGVVLCDATEEDVARLNYYEGGFVYELKLVTAHTGDGAPVQAEVYFPTGGLARSDALWSLETWERDWAALAVLAADEAMAGYGRWSDEEIARRLPMMYRRAAARLAAATRDSDGNQGFDATSVDVVSTARRHTDFFALDQYELTHPRYGGGRTAVLNREVFRVGDAATVLPYDPVADAVLLVEQFRTPVWANGDPSPWVIEPVSGLVDPGESPEAAAIREAREEAGVVVRSLDPVARAYSSTGSSTEFVHMFVGLADFSSRNGGGGVPSEGEDIRVFVEPFERFADNLRTQLYRDAPLVATGLWLVLHRDRLRASA